MQWSGGQISLFLFYMCTVFFFSGDVLKAVVVEHSHMLIGCMQYMRMEQLMFLKCQEVKWVHCFAVTL